MEEGETSLSFFLNLESKRRSQKTMLSIRDPATGIVAYETGQLSTSQCRGLIIVLYKKNDHLDTKNWRPISLLNVDYKITTRTISGRLLAVLSSIIGPDQTCGVPGRTISSNLFLIRDLLEYIEGEDIPLALLSLDQEKAFDRVDWGFLLRTLETFNFGPMFLRWIKLFYTNIESAVVINGWTSAFFSAFAGCAPRLSVVSSIVCHHDQSSRRIHPHVTRNYWRATSKLSSNLSAPGMPTIPPWRLPLMHQ